MSDPDASLDVLVGQVARTFAQVSALPDYRPEYVVFGSAVLWLHGLRDAIGDVDVFVSPRIWGAFADDGWTVCTPRPDDPSFLELDLSPHPSIHAFYDWTKRDPWVNPARCFEGAETIRGVRCAAVTEVASHKIEAYLHNPDSGRHQKHLDDLRTLGYRSGKEWARLDGIRVLDNDGWRRADGVTLSTPITRPDYDERIVVSTAVPA